MGRHATPQLLWAAALLLVGLALPLVFANVGHVATRGMNEEIGGILVIGALAAAVAGLAIRGSLERTDAKLAAAGIGIVVVVSIALLAFMAMSRVDHDAYRTIDWDQVDRNASIEVQASDLPPTLVVDLRAARDGEGGFTTVPRGEYDAMWDRLDALGARAVPPEPGVFVLFEGRTFRLWHGPVM